MKTFKSLLITLTIVFIPTLSVADDDDIVGLWHSTTDFFGTDTVAILTFHEGGTLTSRDVIDFGAPAVFGGTPQENAPLGGNQGVWIEDEEEEGTFHATAVEIAYEPNGNPISLSIARATLTLEASGQTFSGTLSLADSPCVINNCPVPDLNTPPTVVVPVIGTKLIGPDDD